MEEKEVRLLEKILNEPSFYPQKIRKSLEQRKQDLSDWHEKYGEINEFYNVWGLDCVDAGSCDIWLDHGILRKQRYEINSKFVCSGDTFSTNYTVLTRDKSIFEMFAAQVLGDNRKYVTSYALLKGFLYLSHEGDYEARRNDTFHEFIKRHEGEKLVFKRTTGCSGNSVHVCKINNGEIVWGKKRYMHEDFLRKIMEPAATWMIQPFVKQHPFMQRLNPNTVNIIRIVTFHTGKRVFPVPPMLVYARNDTEVCNSDQGSYYAGMSLDGVIEDKAIDRKEYRFVPCPAGGQTLPYFREIVEVVCKLHQALPELFTVGWDVALSEEGPVVLEGNDGWCPYVNEWSPETALRSTWNKAVNERKKYFNF